MATATGIASIQSYFRVAPSDMPKLSTPMTKPNYTSIKKFIEALEQNAMSVPSIQTELGHLALVISQSDYTATNEGTPWTKPKNPGSSPTNPVSSTALVSTPTRTTRSGSAGTTPTRGTTTAISLLPFTAAETIRAFNEEQQEYRKYTNTRTALRNLILNAVDDKYICKLKHPRTHYALVAPYDLIEHLTTTYGTVDYQDRTNNEERMKKQWNHEQPIEEIFEQLKDGQTFAQAGGEMISDGQLVRWGYTNIHSTNLFNSECKKWRQRSASERTWDHFVKYFTQADDDRRKTKAAVQTPETTGEVYTANQVQEILQNEIAAIMAQLNADKENSPPQQAPTEKANSTQGIKAEDIKSMIKEALKEHNGRGTGGYKNPSGGGKGKPQAQAHIDGRPVSYCWTHGVTRNLHHSSKSCSRKNEGHKEEATFGNRMGGSDIIQQPRK